MRDQIERVADTMTSTVDLLPSDSIRDMAKKMADIAIDNYVDELLESALLMVAAVTNYANELG